MSSSKKKKGSAAKAAASAASEKTQVKDIDKLQCNMLFHPDERTCGRVSLNAKELRALGVRVGGMIEILDEASDSVAIILQAWPSSTLPAGHASICRLWKSNFAETSKKCTLQRLQRSMKSTDCATLTVEAESSAAPKLVDSSGFKDYVTAVLLGTNLAVSNAFTVIWRGAQIRLRILQATALYSSTEPQSIEDISGRLVRYRVVPLTTVRIISYNAGSKESLGIENLHEESHDMQSKEKFLRDGSPQCSLDDTLARVANEFGGYGQQMRDAVKLTLQGLALEPTISVRKDFMGAENCDTFASSSDTIKETVQSILQKVSQPPKGLLIHGPPGTGKSKLMRAIVRALSQSCSSVELSLDILFKSETQSGDVERDLQKVFTQATESAPCCVLIDDMHLLCPSRGDSRGSSTASALQKRIVTSLLTLIDGVNSSNTRSVFIIATSAKPSGIDQAFRRPGRLDKEIELPVPSADERAEILRVLMVERGMAVHDSDSNMSSNGQKGSIPSETVRQIAKNAHGMVGSDLLLAIKEAHILACKDSQNGEGMGHLTSRMSALSVGDADGEGVSTKGLNESWGHGINLGLTVTLTESHLREAISKVNPSALREVVVEVPSVRWTDIGGMHEVKQSLKEVVEWPLEYPQLFASLNLSAPRGVLLYGPPGCSKTLMAKALATESSMNFLAVRGPELLSKWLGESEKAVQGLFRRARAAAPSIVFFDEIDALASKRGDTSAGVNDRVLSQLLAEIDGIQGLRRVVVIAATNRPDMLDSALMRPGRIDRKVYVPPPDKESREQILNLELRKMPLDSTVEGVISDVVDKSEGFSGAEVVAISQEAAMLAIDNGDTELSSDHLLTSVASITPQITPEMVRFYERLKASYK